MALKEKLQAEVKDAMKASEKLKLSVLRLLQSTIKNKEIEVRRELNDDEVLSLITTGIKQRREAIKLFNQGGRDDLVEKESQELAILKTYLPPQLSEEEIRAVIQRAMAATGATSPNDLGKVMKQVMAEVKGQAPGELVNRLARQLLT